MYIKHLVSFLKVWMSLYYLFYTFSNVTPFKNLNVSEDIQKTE